VVVVSGHTGPANYEYFAYDLAAQGYYAVLVDGNDFWVRDRTGEEKLKAVIARARQSPHALPGKVAVVGFSLGGASTLSYAARMPELVAGVVAYYPFTSFIGNPEDFISKVKVPVLLMAGGRDRYKDCCRVETARKLAELAGSTPGAPRLELVEYPDAEHGWIIKSLKTYRGRDSEDGFKRTVAFLRESLGE
jgi:dienelactone hydrolase